MGKLNVGDRVKMVMPSSYTFDKVGNTGTVVELDTGRVMVSVDGQRKPRFNLANGWCYFESAENWELIEEESKMAKFKIGDKVVIKGNESFHGFQNGDVVVITRVIGPSYRGHEVGDYPENSWMFGDSEIEEYKEEKEIPKCKFKVGDLVKGNNPNRHFITNDRMTKAEVISVHGPDYIKIKVLEHMDDTVVLGVSEFGVDPQYFDFYEETKKEVNVAPKFKVGDKVRVTQCRYGHAFNIGQTVEITKVCHDENLLNGKNHNYKCVSDEGDTWFLDDIEMELVQKEKPKTTVLKLGEYKIVFNGDTTVVTDGTRKGVAKRHPDDEYDAVVGLQVALERFNGGTRKPKIGDKVRVLKVDGNSPYSDHHWKVGDVAEVTRFAHGGKDTSVVCYIEGIRYAYQTLIAGEYEVLG